MTACGQDRPPGQPGAAVDEARSDPYHSAPRDTLPPAIYAGWKQYRVLCDRCHGEDARGTSFGPDLIAALRPTGSVPDEPTFVALMVNGRSERGMPPAGLLGLSPDHLPGLYSYLKGRSMGEFRGGRPALRVD